MTFTGGLALVCCAGWFVIGGLFASGANEPVSATDDTPSAASQSVAGQEKQEDQQEKASSDKHMFGVLPNMRTIRDGRAFEPMSVKEKFNLARQEDLDWSTFLVAGGFAGISHLENQNPSFGQGMEGFSKRYAGAYGDQAIGNLMTEGVFPSLLHQDPRYFERGSGTGWSRAGYALSRVFVTRADSGKWQFNTSELVGNSLAVAISNAYYPGTRNVSDNVVRLAQQLATDAVADLLKEFWPDVKRKLFQRHHVDSQAPPAGQASD